MLAFLRRPFPYPELSTAAIALRAGAVGLFVALFLIVFQPFGTARVDFPAKTTFLAGYGVIAAAVTFLFLYLPRRLAQGLTDERRWTVGWQLATNLLALVVAAVVTYFYLLQLGGSVSWSGFSAFSRSFLAIAVLPMIGLVTADYITKLRRYERGAAALRPLGPSPAPAAAPPEPDLALTDATGAVTAFAPASVWMLRSDGNYVEVWQRPAGPTELPTRTVLRGTLKSFAAQLPDRFAHCHRSHLVQLDLVERVSGNAQGYRLHRGDCPELSVPVSRGKSERVLSRLPFRSSP